MGRKPFIDCRVAPFINYIPTILQLHAKRRFNCLGKMAFSVTDRCLKVNDTRTSYTKASPSSREKAAASTLITFCLPSPPKRREERYDEASPTTISDSDNIEDGLDIPLTFPQFVSTFHRLSTNLYARLFFSSWCYL